MCHVKHIPSKRSRVLLTGDQDIECEHVFITPVGRTAFEMLLSINYSPNCKARTAAKLFIDGHGGIMMDAVPPRLSVRRTDALSRALRVAVFALEPNTPLHSFLCTELGSPFEQFAKSALHELNVMAGQSQKPHGTAICNALKTTCQPGRGRAAP